jgi:voltage-gated potassium channel
MKFTFWFIETFFWLLLLASPLLIFLSLVIYLLGSVVNRCERWNLGLVGTFYYSFVTATTIGYGDFCPVKKLSRVLAIFIGITGLVLTGLIVAIGLQSASISLRHLVAEESKGDTVEFFKNKIYKELNSENKEQNPVESAQ